MRFALNDINRIEATRGSKGICPGCGSELVAKCGETKIHHWAHKGSRNCDPWWENETEWHRLWKNNFSTEWQETILHDAQSGEKHIADIRTKYGLVVEFQHSHIEPAERRAREDFYKNMLWVVDGSRLKRDYPRFFKELESFRLTNIQGYYLVDFPEKCFPSSWLGSSVPVIFDFRGIEPIRYASDKRYPLYYLFPRTNKMETVLAVISRESFVNNINSGVLFKTQPL